MEYVRREGRNKVREEGKEGREVTDSKKKVHVPAQSQQTPTATAPPSLDGSSPPHLSPTALRGEKVIAQTGLPGIAGADCRTGTWDCGDYTDTWGMALHGSPQVWEPLASPPPTAIPERGLPPDWPRGQTGQRRHYPGLQGPCQATTAHTAPGSLERTIYPLP